MATAQDSTLTSTLNRPISDPFAAVERINRAPNLLARGRMATEMEPSALRQQSQAAKNLRTAEAEAQRAQITKEEEIEKRNLESIERAQTQRQASMGQQPERTISAFRPEKGLELAALTAIFGAFAGRVSGQAAMRAIEGISEGYRLGQEDLYKREVANYEAEVAKYKQKIEEASRIYEDALKLAQTKRGAEMVELKKLAPLLQGSVIAAHADVGDTNSVFNVLQDAKKLGNQAELKMFEAGLKPRPTPVIQDQQLAQAGVPTSVVDPETSVPYLQKSPYRGMNAEAQQEIFKGERNKYEKFQKAAEEENKKATKTLRDMSRAKSLLNKIETGGFFGLPLVGTPYQAVRAAYDKEISEFDTIAQNMVREAYVPGEGQISNYERELFARSNIGLGRPKGTNEALIQAYEVAAKNTMERNQFFDLYFRTNKTINGADTLWSIYSETNPIFRVDKDDNIYLNPRRKSYQEFFANPVIDSSQTKDGSTYRLNYNTLSWEKQ